MCVSVLPCLVHWPLCYAKKQVSKRAQQSCGIEGTAHSNASIDRLKYHNWPQLQPPLWANASTATLQIKCWKSRRRIFPPWTRIPDPTMPMKLVPSLNHNIHHSFSSNYRHPWRYKISQKANLSHRMIPINAVSFQKIRVLLLIWWGWKRVIPTFSSRTIPTRTNTILMPTKI